MRGKKFADGVFYVIGTIILLSIGVVVAINFYNDSKFFESTFSAIKNVTKDAEDPKPGTPEYETFKYKRPVERGEASGSAGTKAGIRKTTTTGALETEGQFSRIGRGVNIELVSYLRDRAATDKFIASLKLRGYTVSEYRPASTLGYSTRIIERNEKAHGMELYKIMKTGVLIKDYKSNYKYDLTVILGNDYRP